MLVTVPLEMVMVWVDGRLHSCELNIKRERLTSPLRDIPLSINSLSVVT